MAFTKDEYILCLETRTQDTDQGKIKDETPYGAPNQLRSDRANFLIAAKMDENQNLTFLDGINNSDPLNSLEYFFPTLVDGAYRFILSVFEKWGAGVNYQIEVQASGVITQYADIIYHVTSTKYFKAIQVNGPATSIVEPTVTVGWEAYWTEFVPSSTSIMPQINTDQFVIHIHDDIVTFKFEDCIKDKLVDVGDEILCGVCDKWDELMPSVKMLLMLNEAQSENWQNKQPRADVIIKQATKKFGCGC